MSEAEAWMIVGLGFVVFLLSVVAGMTYNAYYSNNNLKEIQIACIQKGGIWISTHDICVICGGK